MRTRGDGRPQSPDEKMEQMNEETSRSSDLAPADDQDSRPSNQQDDAARIAREGGRAGTPLTRPTLNEMQRAQANPDEQPPQPEDDDRTIQTIVRTVKRGEPGYEVGVAKVVALMSDGREKIVRADEVDKRR